MKYTFGYIFLLITSISIPFLLLASKKHNKNYHRFGWIVFYNFFCLIVFIHVPRIYELAFVKIQEIPGNNHDFQYALILLSANAIFQLYTIAKITILFYRIIIAFTINGIVCLIMFNFIDYGIINLVWFTIFSGIFGGYILVKAIFVSLEEIIEKTDKIKDNEYKSKVLEFARDETNRLLKIAVQGFLALGASVGISMSILFRGGETAWQNPSYQLSAARLVTGFALISLGLAFWIIKPYLANFVKVREYFKDSISAQEKLIS